MLIEFSPLN
jgi:hypothetical protein